MLLEADTDGLVEKTADGFRITEKGRPVLRSIYSCFDAYLEDGAAGGQKPRYSASV